MNIVYIVMDRDLGWDCVVAVFSKEDDAKACVEDRGSSSFYVDNIIDDPDFIDGVFNA